MKRIGPAPSDAALLEAAVEARKMEDGQVALAILDLVREVQRGRKIAREVLSIQEAALGEDAKTDPVWTRADEIIGRDIPGKTGP